ncbi:MAG: efflux RND transporter periplasmic adaptor subunit [Opitutales bacterium]
MSDSTSTPKRTWILCGSILLAAILILTLIFSSEPVAERETATLSRAMLVEVIPAEYGRFRPIIVETGTVAAAREVQLAPEVDGRILELHPDFTPGGFIEAGESVLSIDPADFQYALSQRKNELRQAQTELALEMGRQQVARRDFELLGQRLPEGTNDLVLREPQLAAAKTQVEAAEAALEQAQLNLDRTELRSPFDAQILGRSVNLGSQVSRGMPVAEIVGIEQYWVMATVPPSKLPFIEFPQADEPGASVELVKRATADGAVSRTGRLYRLVGALEPNTRLAKVVVEVEDPLSRSEASAGKAPLLIGEFLEVRITGKTLKDVARMPIDYLRKNDTIWVMNQADKLEIRRPEILFKDARYAYLRSGLEGGERIITSSLSRVTEGAELRIETAGPSTE